MYTKNNRCFLEYKEDTLYAEDVTGQMTLHTLLWGLWDTGILEKMIDDSRQHSFFHPYVVEKEEDPDSIRYVVKEYRPILTDIGWAVSYDVIELTQNRLNPINVPVHYFMAFLEQFHKQEVFDIMHSPKPKEWSEVKVPTEKLESPGKHCFFRTLEEDKRLIELISLVINFKIMSRACDHGIIEHLEGENRDDINEYYLDRLTPEVREEVLNLSDQDWELLETNLVDVQNCLVDGDLSYLKRRYEERLAQSKWDAEHKSPDFCWDNL